MGSVVAMALSMELGFSKVLLTGAVLYLLATVSFWGAGGEG
jgi:hypothetical protein